MSKKSSQFSALKCNGEARCRPLLRVPSAVEWYSVLQPLISLMRRARGVAVLATTAIVACSPPRAPYNGGCDIPRLMAIPAEYEVPGRHEFRLGNVLDTSYAHRSVGQLVFQVSSTYALIGTTINAYTVVLGDSSIKDLPALGAVGDSAGVAMLKAVPVAYTFAQVRRIGYRNHTVPLVIRPGYTDTVIVTLTNTPLCVVE
jgi:hypothetical protein